MRGWCVALALGACGDDDGGAPPPILADTDGVGTGSSSSEDGGEPPTPDYSRARGRFLRVLREYKDFRDYDLALYVDGFLATEENKPEESLDRFNRILAWFPKSRFVPGKSRAVSASCRAGRKAYGSSGKNCTTAPRDSDSPGEAFG